MQCLRTTRSANLFRVIRDLTASGVAVIYISHRLDEIRQIGDRVTVLKDGRTVANGLPARTTPTREIVNLMTGRDVEFPFPPRRVDVAAQADTILSSTVISGAPGEFKHVSFDVHAGEILGLAGLVGSGRSEILETVYGARRAASGTVTLAAGRCVLGNVTGQGHRRHGLGAGGTQEPGPVHVRERGHCNITAGFLAAVIRGSVS